MAARLRFIWSGIPLACLTVRLRRVDCGHAPASAGIAVADVLS
jgi:hypothetical protein